MQQSKRRISAGVLARNLALSIIFILAVNKLVAPQSLHTYADLAPLTAAATFPPAARNIDLSLIVPATYIDFVCYKRRFFTHLYENIIDPPKEIIFVVSSVPAHISTVDFPGPPQTRGSKFNSTIQILSFHSAHNAAQNRNIGASTATGELLTFFDMDDVIHPQRFEVIRYLLLQEYPAIDAALFGFKMGSNSAAGEYQFEKVKLEYLDAPYDSEHLHSKFRQFILDNPNRRSSNILGCCAPIGVAAIHNGWGTYRREVFFRYQYNETINRGQDSDLNKRLILGKEKFTIWKVVLGFYETPEDREKLCGEDLGSIF